MPVIYGEEEIIFAYPQIKSGGSGKIEVSKKVNNTYEKSVCNGILGYL